MARLAMVRPEMISDLRSWRLYWGPHWKMGKKNWSHSRSLWYHCLFLNLWSGSSGKKISDKRSLSFWKVVLWGGRETLCISMGDVADNSEEILIETSLVLLQQGLEKSSILFEFTPIGKSKRQVWVKQNEWMEWRSLLGTQLSNGLWIYKGKKRGTGVIVVVTQQLFYLISKGKMVI